MTMPDVDQGLFSALGFHLTTTQADLVVISWEVTDAHLQPYGLVHGGVHCAAVESAASIGAALWAEPDARVVGVSNRTSFFRPVTGGTLTATATPIDQNPTTQLWKVDINDAQGRLVAQGEVRLQATSPRN